jgi:hypothetical protein
MTTNRRGKSSTPLSDATIRSVEAMLAVGTDHLTIASAAGVSAGTVGRIAKGKYRQATPRRHRSACHTIVEVRALAARATKLRLGQIELEAAKAGKEK